MTSAYGGIAVVLVAVVFALAGQVLVQRSVPLPLRESHNTAIGMIYAALYVMYALFLGPLAALRRSNELVRGHFELVFLTTAVADAGMLGGLALTGSETWGQWAGLTRHRRNTAGGLFRDRAHVRPVATLVESNAPNTLFST